MKSKKGAEMTVGTIIIIVLALIVLVVLVLGFTGGWTNLWGRITSFFGGANVDSVIQACQVACSTESKYDFCNRTRTVKAETAEFYVLDDGKLVNLGTSGANLKKEAKASCENLAKLKSDLGFTACPDLC